MEKPINPESLRIIRSVMAMRSCRTHVMSLWVRFVGWNEYRCTYTCMKKWRIYLKTNKCNETAYLMNTYTICGVCIKVGNEHKVGKQKH